MTREQLELLTDEAEHKLSQWRDRYKEAVIAGECKLSDHDARDESQALAKIAQWGEILIRLRDFSRDGVMHIHEEGGGHG